MQDAGSAGPQVNQLLLRVVNGVQHNELGGGTSKRLSLIEQTTQPMLVPGKNKR